MFFHRNFHQNFLNNLFEKIIFYQLIYLCIIVITFFYPHFYYFHSDICLKRCIQKINALWEKVVLKKIHIFNDLIIFQIYFILKICAKCFVKKVSKHNKVFFSYFSFLLHKCRLLPSEYSA